MKILLTYMTLHNQKNVYKHNNFYKTHYYLIFLLSYSHSTTSSYSKSISQEYTVDQSNDDMVTSKSSNQPVSILHIIYIYKSKC